MFRRLKWRANVQNQTNKAKAGNIKNSTIEIQAGTSVQALILEKLNSIENSLNKNWEDTKNIKKGLSIYVQNNGVKPEIKKIVKEILE